MLLDEFLSHVTDVKPITARQCVAALPEIAEAKPNLIPRIRAALEHPVRQAIQALKSISNQYPLAVVDFVLDDLGRPAGKGFEANLMEQADLSGYPDSMQPLVLKDIVAALQKMERFS